MFNLANQKMHDDNINKIMRKYNNKRKYNQIKREIKNNMGMILINIIGWFIVLPIMSMVFWVK